MKGVGSGSPIGESSVRGSQQSLRQSSTALGGRAVVPLVGMSQSPTARGSFLALPPPPPPLELPPEAVLPPPVAYQEGSDLAVPRPVSPEICLEDLPPPLPDLDEFIPPSILPAQQLPSRGVRPAASASVSIPNPRNTDYLPMPQVGRGRSGSSGSSLRDSRESPLSQSAPTRHLPTPLPSFPPATSPSGAEPRSPLSNPLARYPILPSEVDSSNDYGAMPTFRKRPISGYGVSPASLPFNELDLSAPSTSPSFPISSPMTSGFEASSPKSMDSDYSLLPLMGSSPTSTSSGSMILVASRERTHSAPDNDAIGKGLASTSLPNIVSPYAARSSEDLKAVQEPSRDGRTRSFGEIPRPRKSSTGSGSDQELPAATPTRLRRSSSRQQYSVTYSFREGSTPTLENLIQGATHVGRGVSKVVYRKRMPISNDQGESKEEQVAIITFKNIPHDDDHEVAISHRLRDKRVRGAVPIYDIFEIDDVDQKMTVIIALFCNQNSLHQVIERGKLSEESTRYEVASKMLEALASYHRAGIINHDIKLKNILCHLVPGPQLHSPPERRIYIADHGMACRVHTKAKNAKIAPQPNFVHAPAELITMGQDAWNNPKYDVFMAGVALWQLFCDKDDEQIPGYRERPQLGTPEYNSSDAWVHWQQAKNDISSYSGLERLPKDLRRLIKRMLDPSINKRIASQDASELMSLIAEKAIQATREEAQSPVPAEAPAEPKKRGLKKAFSFSRKHQPT